MPKHSSNYKGAIKKMFDYFYLQKVNPTDLLVCVKEKLIYNVF